MIGKANISMPQGERLTVNVVGLDSGFEVSVIVDGTIIGTSTEVTSSFLIPEGTQYTVSASEVDGYSTPIEQTFTAGKGKNEVTLEYFPCGVYILDVNGRYWDVSDWDGSVDADCVAVSASACRYGVALSDAYYSRIPFGSSGILLEGIMTTTSSSEAITDYDGAGNTEKIINQLGEDVAAVAKYCVDYTFPSGARGYLPAAGEWQVLIDNISAISTALSTCGGTSLSAHYHGSTQYDSENLWHAVLGWNNWIMYHDKTHYSYIRAFRSL